MDKRASRCATFLAYGIIVGLALATVVSTPAQAKSKYQVILAADRSQTDGIYQADELITFTVKVEKDGELLQEVPAAASLAYSITDDHTSSVTRGQVKLKDGVGQFTWRQKEPMVLLCSVTYWDKDEANTQSRIGVAVAPEKIVPTTTEPDDFLSYWNAQKALLAKVPLEAKLEPVDTRTPGIELYKVAISSIKGRYVRGYLAKPKGDGPFPITLEFPSAGVGVTQRSRVEERAAKGMLSLEISVHDLPIDESRDFYKKEISGPLKNYSLQGRENRDTYFYHDAILGNVRAIDYLTSRSDWDKKNMIVTGASQGGGLSLITAGIDGRVTAAAAAVPALCDHTGRNFGRRSGWPQLVPMDEESGKLDPTILEVSRYYDAVNFARHIKVPAMVEVGLIDVICSPTTGIAAFNAIPGTNKHLYLSPLLGHGRHPLYDKELSKFLAAQTAKP